MNVLVISKAHRWYDDHLATTGISTKIILNKEPEDDSVFQKCSFLTIDNYISLFDKEHPELIDLIVRTGDDNSQHIQGSFDKIFEDVSNIILIYRLNSKYLLLF